MTQVFCFSYPTRVFPRYFLREAFFARRGRIPMRSAVSFETISEDRGLLKIAVDWDEAGTICVPYLHKRYGLTYFSTETLRPGKKPLSLLRELARSQLSRVMSRFYDWPSRGLKISPFLIEAIREGIVRMCKLAVMDDTEPDFDEAAQGVFESLIVLSHLLLDQFIDQSLTARRSIAQSYPVFLGFCGKKTERLTDFSAQNPDYQYLFEAWNPSLTWRDIEPEEGVFCWDRLDEAVHTAQKNHWRLMLGPLVRWDRSSLPHWIVRQLDDPYLVRKALFRYADTLIRRFGKTNYWILFEGIEAEIGSILVSKRIEWADALARTVRSVNPDAKIVIGFTRPWGDALRHTTELPPLEIALRLAMNPYIDGFFLHFKLGFSAEATLPRDAFDLNTLLDSWNQFGKMLYISFSVPSSPAFDTPLWETPGSQELVWTPKTQQETVQRFFLSFLTRKSVQAVFWNQIEDQPIQKIPPALLMNVSEDTKTFQEMSKTLAEDSSTVKMNSPVPPDPNKTAILPVLIDRDKKPDQVENDLSSTGPLPPEFSLLNEEIDPQTVLFPHSGLLNADGKAKPALKKLAALQRAYM